MRRDLFGRYRIAGLAGCLATVSLVAGCGEATPTASPTQGASPPQAESLDEAPERQPEAPENLEVSQPTKPDFQPPYANRVELFLPPTRKQVAASSGNHASEVLLRGFVNVDQPRALLVVDGRLHALAVGERRGNIEVIQIERPSVTLQRGRVRWTESLFPEI